MLPVVAMASQLPAFFMFDAFDSVGGRPLYAFPIGDSALASDYLSL